MKELHHLSIHSGVCHVPAGRSLFMSQITWSCLFCSQIFCWTTATREIYAKRAAACGSWLPSAAGRTPPRSVMKEWHYSSSDLNSVILFVVTPCLFNSPGNTKPTVPDRVYRCERENQVGRPGWSHPAPLQGKQTSSQSFGSAVYLHTAECMK